MTLSSYLLHLYKNKELSINDIIRKHLIKYCPYNIEKQKT